MAKEDNKRFQLEKNKDREFDISKSGKRKFDLTKDAEEKLAVSTSVPSDSQHPKESSENKSKLLIGIIIVLAVLAVLAWWLFSKPSTPLAPMLEEQKPAVEEVVVPSGETSEESEPSSGTDGEAQVPEAPSSEPQVSSQVPSVSSANQDNIDVTDDIEAEALKVIRGAYGDGDTRKRSLGSRYNLIQDRVNQLKREGLF